ncbi:hypothetical protein RJT34_13687 [Clitoria ternatea]|uniref:Uncharacterized protein n=1 Tax=Clitoria ternatea TaxID=43366 RepID=A0AAN9JRI7_CLITE
MDKKAKNDCCAVQTKNHNHNKSTIFLLSSVLPLEILFALDLFSSSLSFSSLLYLTSSISFCDSMFEAVSSPSPSITKEAPDMENPIGKNLKSRGQQQNRHEHKTTICFWINICSWCCNSPVLKQVLFCSSMISTHKLLDSDHLGLF